jgi:hypothetical protein
MDVMGSLHALRRRWLLALLLLLATLAGAAALGMRPGPYQSGSQVVLLPSQQISKPNGNNPYLSFGGSVSLTADLVRREMMDPRTALALAASGFPSTYQVVDDPATSGPVLDVTVTGSSKAAVEHTLYGVTAEISTKLAGMQAGTSRANRITSLVVSINPQATLLVSKKARSVVVALGLGLVFTIAVPQLVDASIARRRAMSMAAEHVERQPPAQADSASPGTSYRHQAAGPQVPAQPGVRGRDSGEPGVRSRKLPAEFDHLYEPNDPRTARRGSAPARPPSDPDQVRERGRPREADPRSR